MRTQFGVIDCDKLGDLGLQHVRHPDVARWVLDVADSPAGDVDRLEGYSEAVASELATARPEEIMICKNEPNRIGKWIQWENVDKIYEEED